MVTATGALIVRVQDGAYTNLVTYKWRCAKCAYVSPEIISVTIPPPEQNTAARDVQHEERFVCPACASPQTVQIEG